MGFGSSKEKSSSKPKLYNYKDIMTPWAMQGQQQMMPSLMNQAEAGFQGYGFSPSEMTRRTRGLASGISEYAGGMKDQIRGQSAKLGQFGGVREGALDAIDAAKVMSFGQGLGDIQNQEHQQAQSNIDRALSFLTWNPPAMIGQKSQGQSSSFNFAGPSK
jgi:hypothetical protein